MALKQAPSDRIDAYGESAFIFVERTLGIRPLFLSDDSSMSDFSSVADLQSAHRKAMLLYGIDTEMMEDTPLWKGLASISHD